MRRGGIRKRSDVHYNKPEYRSLVEQLVSTYPDVQRLDGYADVNCGPFGSEITSSDYVEQGVPLLRISNITKEGQIDTDDLVFITEAKAGKLISTQVKPGDIVISQRGTLGLPAVVPEGFPTSNISANLIAVRNLSGLSAEFVQLYFSSSVGGKQLERTQSGQVQSKITTEDVASVLIPQTSSELELVSAMQAARARRAAKLQAADAALAGIDAFLLEQLGLTPPPEQTQTVLSVRLHELQNSRIDAGYYLSKPISATNAKYPITMLGDYLEEIHYGASVNNSYQDDGIPLLRIKDIKPPTVDVKEVVYLPESMRLELGRAFVHEGDFLITRSGSVGMVAKVPRTCEGFAFGSFMIRFVVNPDTANINQDYLITWLNGSVAQNFIQRHKIGAIQGNITIGTIKEIPVPLPEKHTQDAISQEVQKRREAAENLRKEAGQEWEQAKAEFERRLLGMEK